MMNDQLQMMNSHHQVINNYHDYHRIFENSMMNNAYNDKMTKNYSSQMLSQQCPPHMMPPNYGQWTTPPSLPPLLPLPRPRTQVMNSTTYSNFLDHNDSKPLRNNWNRKKTVDKHKNPTNRGRNSSNSSNLSSNCVFSEVDQKNWGKIRRNYNHKKKFNNRMEPYAHAPRNTTSYIIRAKKSGGIASLISPCPTPSILPTPVFSPAKEMVVDMAKEEWGVDGYGSMKGLIRLRSPPSLGFGEVVEDYEDEDEAVDEGEGGVCEGSSGSDDNAEDHVVVERRLDHDLSRFEMVYPRTGRNAGGNDGGRCGGSGVNVLENRVDDQDLSRFETVYPISGGHGGGNVSENRVDSQDLSRFEMMYPRTTTNGGRGRGGGGGGVLESRVDDQDTQIAQLEEENLTLKDRVYYMERELEDMRNRLSCLEKRNQLLVDVNEEDESDSSSEAIRYNEGPTLMGKDSGFVDVGI